MVNKFVERRQHNDLIQQHHPTIIFGLENVYFLIVTLAGIQDGFELKSDTGCFPGMSFEKKVGR